MIFMAAAMLMFASCNKEKQTEEKIVGSWIETESLYLYTHDGVCDTTSMFEEGESIEITFKADKTYSSVYHSLEGDSEDHGTWSVKGDKFTLNGELDSADFTIDQLDKNVFNITHREEGNDGNSHYTLEIIIRMTRK